MRPESSEIVVPARRERLDRRVRRAAERQTRTRRPSLEALEARELLAIAALTDPTVLNRTDLAQHVLPQGSTTPVDDSTPSIAVDPTNPQHLAAAFIRRFVTPNGPVSFTVVEFSTNGGVTWQTIGTQSHIANPTTTNPTVPFTFSADPSVAFDRTGAFYVLERQYTAQPGPGALVLYKFFDAQPVLTNVVYEWITNGASQPIVAVDNNLASFTDTRDDGTQVVQNDPHAGNVYIAWTTVEPILPPPTVDPDDSTVARIRLIGSGDGGATFSGQYVISPNGGNGFFDLSATPRLAVAQGSTAVAGTTNPRVSGGLLSVVYDTISDLDDINNQGADTVYASQVVDGAVGREFADNIGGIVGDAFDPGNSQPHVPTATDFPIQVNITDPNFKLSDLDVRIDLTAPALAELRIELIPPPGSGLPTALLVNNQTDQANNTNTNIGISGANLGTTASGIRLGTIFDDQAFQAITDRVVAAPFTGHYRPEAGGSLTAYNGSPLSALNGTWTLRITDFRSQGANPPPQFLADWSLLFSRGGSVENTTPISGFGLTGVAMPSSIEGVPLQNIAATPISARHPQAGPAVAVDNSLGAFSSYQGRIYAVYTGASFDQAPFTFTSATNTDIFLTYSDDGGFSWSFPTKVNDDSVADGYTEGSRVQLQPEVAVDQTTGTLVVSWLDARDDASNNRVATYVTYSVDGGQTFSKQVYANAPKTAVDAITGKTINLGPVPENQSAGNPVRETQFSFGDRQGLVVSAGQIHPIWSSNANGGGNLVDHRTLGISTATLTIPVGPRIIDGTMGPVGLPGDSLNGNRTADGTPIAQSFIVTFDRPIGVVPDPANPGRWVGETFLPNDVQVFYRDTTPGNISGGPVPVIAVTPIDVGFFGPAGAHGATRFRVDFAPRSSVGTYSYVVGSDIRDRVRVANQLISPSGPRQVFNSTDTPKALPDIQTVTSTIPLSGFPAGQIISNVKVGLSLTHTFDSDLRITLIAPDGSRILLSNRRGGSGDNFTNTVFDDAATRAISNGIAPFTGSFRPDQPLAFLRGKPINGNWTLEIADVAFFDSGTLLTWSLDLQPGTVTSSFQPGNFMDENGNASAGESQFDQFAIPRPLDGIAGDAPFDQDTLPLIVPAPHVASTRVAGSPTTSDNLVLNRTVNSVDVTFDRDMAADTFTAADVLRVLGPSGAIAGPYTVRAAYNSLDVNKTLVDGGTTTSIIVVPNDGGLFTINDLVVQVGLTHAKDTELTLTLIAPDGTRIRLARGVGGQSGKNFTDTVFDDNAAMPIDKGIAPFNASYRPVDGLAALKGKQLRGTWTLEVVDSSTGNVGTIDSWSLAASPQGLGYARTFRVEFPRQQLSGTYTLTLGPDILSRNGDPIDANLNAGVDLLRGVAPSGPTVPVTYNSTNVPVTTLDLKTVVSTLVVPDDFLIAGLTLTLNITHPNVSDLEATLIAPDGTRIKLFTNVGNTGTKANFTNTVFDDAAGTPIQFGGPPFFGRFNPQQPLSQLVGRNASGTWTLELKDDVNGNSGSLTGWGLTFQKPVPNSGIGEPVADRSAVSFRIFTMDPTNTLASSVWTPVGPASINNGGGSGRIGGLAVDPSDPSGNTMYVAGASGGVWKTTNFLTTDPDGPTYIPLTDFGPTFGLNVGSISVFGRNNDPNQSIVFVATGEGDTGSTGVGFLRSMDGGATWQLLDSLVNTAPDGTILPFSQRRHEFVGSTSFKVVVDPKATPTGDVIAYAALSGTNGGIYRTLDTGRTWQLMRGGQATDVVLDLASGTGSPGGNIQIIYGAFRGEGVFSSPNRGQVWTPMNGGVGDPLIQQFDIGGSTTPPVAVTAPPDVPGGPKGRIVLAKPFPTGNALQDVQYQGWLYAAVVRTNDRLDGLYMTKDFGQNWVRVRIPTLPPIPPSTRPRAVPTNNFNNPDYDIAGGGQFSQGNYDIAIAVDPTNPNVVYLGGTADGQPTGLIRVDVTRLADAHAFVAYDDAAPDGGLLRPNTTGPLTVRKLDDPPPTVLGDSNTNGYFNLLRDPSNPFLAGATIYVRNAARFNNNGSGTRWRPFDIGGTDQHRFVTMVDPLTGRARLIIGDDQGVFTTVDNGDGTINGGIGNAAQVLGSRNGNLQITQFYYGAAQPSSIAAQAAQALFYGQAQDNGSPVSDPNVLSNGQISWSGPGGDGTGVATDQTGSGIAYRYNWACCGGNGTDFFQVDLPPDGGGIGRTFGLLQQSGTGNTPDPQWPFLGGSNFAVNPLNGNQVIMSSPVSGRLFRTENQGLFWSVIAEPTSLDSTYVQAPAFGAPDPKGPGGVGNLDNFLYAGTAGGRIFVTQTGGGSAGGNAWTNVSAGLDGTPVQAIVTNPTRGSHEAYAVTAGGVFRINDSTAAGATWQNITGSGSTGIFGLVHNIFGDVRQVDTLARSLTSLAVDWRYVIPNDFNDPSKGTHPVLYVGAVGGVFRSIDNGATWTVFPDDSLNNTPPAPGAGGGLSVSEVSDLDLVLGNINPTTGRPDVSTGTNALLATTYGRGSYAIRLSPIVFPNTLAFSLTQPIPPGGSDSGASSTDHVTNVTNPVIEGLSAQSAFGQVVTIELIDQTDPTNPVVIGTGQTDETGRFAIQVQAGYFKSDGTTDGVKTIGVQAVDQAGTRGNIASFQFTLDTTPPAAPAAPDLQATSDSPFPGDPAYVANTTDTDNITFVNGSNGVGPVFSVVSVEPSTTVVSLLRDGVVVATRNGGGPITDPGPISDGPHVYRALQTDQAGNISALGSPLTVVIDATAPNRPAAPVLNPSDDSGTPGDNITNVRLPRLTGVAEPNGTVLLIDAAGTVVGQAPVATNGSFTVQPTLPLAEGTYTFRVEAEDVAGNVSQASLPTTVRILLRTPGVPTLALVSVDDSGLVGDNITNVNRPRLVGTAEPGLTVDIINTATSAVVGTAIVAADGTFQVQLAPVPQSPLADGVYNFVARARDVAGNSSTSGVLKITIVTQIAGNVTPTLLLDPAYDTGFNDTNNPVKTTVIRRPFFIGTAAPGVFVDIIDAAGIVRGSTTASNLDGSYRVQLPNDLSNGSTTLIARVRDIAGNRGTPSAPLTLRIVSVSGDLNVDGKTDLVLFRPAVPATTTTPVTPAVPAQWVVQTTTTPTTVIGPVSTGSTDTNLVPLTADFDGDGRLDYIAFNPKTDFWTIQRSTLGVQTFAFGQPGVDLPAVGDYDADGKADIAVFRPTTGQWLILQSSGGARIEPQNPVSPAALTSGARPVVADYNGDGVDDLVSAGTDAGGNLIWNFRLSAINPVTKAITFAAPVTYAFGGSMTDVPMAMDGGVEAINGVATTKPGDGRADMALYRSREGRWLSLDVASVLASIADTTKAPTVVFNTLFGDPNVDTPVPGDYDGDGTTDMAVYRSKDAKFLVLKSGGGALLTTFGSANTDVPAQAPYELKKPKSSGGVVKTASLLGGSGGGSTAGTSSLNIGAQAASFGSGSKTITSTAAGGNGGSTSAVVATPRNGRADAGTQTTKHAANHKPAHQTPRKAGLLTSLLKGIGRRRGV